MQYASDDENNSSFTSKPGMNSLLRFAGFFFRLQTLWGGTVPPAPGLNQTLNTHNGKNEIGH